MRAQEIVNLLTLALRHDPEAISDLIESRVPCSKSLADAVGLPEYLHKGHYAIGLLGVLNGLVDDGELVVCTIESRKDLRGDQVTGFEVGTAETHPTLFQLKSEDKDESQRRN